MTATETATETTTEMKMQVTANRPPRPTAAASRNCVRHVVRKTLSYRIQGQVERRKGSRDNCILVVCVRYPV